MAAAQAIVVAVIGLCVAVATGRLAVNLLHTELRDAKSREQLLLTTDLQTDSKRYFVGLEQSVQDLVSYSEVTHALMHPERNFSALYNFLDNSQLQGKQRPLALFDFEGGFLESAHNTPRNVPWDSQAAQSIVSTCLAECRTVSRVLPPRDGIDGVIHVAAPAMYGGSDTPEGAMLVCFPLDGVRSILPLQLSESFGIQLCAKGVGFDELSFRNDSLDSDTDEIALPAGLVARLRYYREPLRRRGQALLVEVIGLSVLFLSAGSLLAWLCIHLLILRPLTSLQTRTAEFAVHEQPLRPGRTPIRELNSLNESFERMAEMVELRNTKLRAQTSRLEIRVQERTAEIEATNDKLRTEIAERTQAERMQRHLAAEAERANLAKSQFLATMSHEIRTPMAAILGYCELLGEGDLATEATEQLGVITRNAAHLLHIINDILDLSKIDAEKLEFESTEFDIRAALLDLTDLLRVRAIDKNVAFDIEMTMSPQRVIGDPTRLRQVLANLIGNAIKFTENGSVRLVCRDADEAIPTRAGHARLAFEVHDSGIGMTDTQMEKLFKPFSQVDSSHTRRFGGTGLGLVISQRIVELMGGEITVTSTVGEGSCFAFEVDIELPDTDTCQLPEPAPRAPAPTKIDASTLRLDGTRVLIADDGRDNRRLFSHFLIKAGADVTTVEDGEQAIEVALDESFDIILMDIQMPVVDGYGATRVLRANGIDVPIIAFTAHAMREHEQECLDVGCNGFLSKPVSRDRLVTEVHNQVNGPWFR